MERSTFEKAKNLTDEISHLQFQIEQIERVLEQDSQPRVIELRFEGIGDVRLHGPLNEGGSMIQEMPENQHFEFFLKQTLVLYKVRLNNLEDDLQKLYGSNQKFGTGSGNNFSGL